MLCYFKICKTLYAFYFSSHNKSQCAEIQDFAFTIITKLVFTTFILSIYYVHLALFFLIYLVFDIKF